MLKMTSTMETIDMLIENVIKLNYEQIIGNIKHSYEYLNKILTMNEKVKVLKENLKMKMSDYCTRNLKLCQLYKLTKKQNDIYKIVIIKQNNIKQLTLIYTIKKSLLHVESYIENINNENLIDCDKICEVIILSYELINNKFLIKLNIYKYINCKI